MSFDETVLKMVKPQQIHACTHCGCRFGTRQLLRNHVHNQHPAKPAIITMPVRPATQRPITMFMCEITTIHANTAGRLSDTIQIGPDKDNWNEDISDELVPLPSQQNGADEKELSNEEEDDECLCKSTFYV